MTVRDELRLTDILAAYFSVPLLVSSIYGMNITLPMQREWYAFLLYVLVSVVWFAIVTIVGMRRTNDTVDREHVTTRMQKVPLQRGQFGRPSRNWGGH